MKSIYQDKRFAEYWNKRVGDEGEVYKRYVLDPIMFGLVKSFKDKVVLEVGCGNGYLGKKFLNKNPRRVILSDISKFNIAYAKKKNKDSKFEFLIYDATKRWPLKDKSVDIVYSNMMLNEVDDIITPVGEAFRVLVSGGKFIFSVTHPAWDLFVHAQEQAGNKSKKIINLGGYFRRGFAKYIMGSDSKTNPDLAKEYKEEFRVEHYQRPLSDYFSVLVDVGFTVRRVIEPELTKELLRVNPRFEVYKEHPIGLIFFSVK